MGFFERIARALGFEPPIEAREPGPLAIGPAGRLRLSELPASTALHVGTVVVDNGRIVAVREEVTDAARDPALGVVILAADRDVMRGLVLDWDGDRWAARLPMRVDAADTPNPDSRMYEVDRPLVRGGPRFFMPGQPAVPDLAVRLLAVPGVASILVRANTLTIERTAGLAWSAVDPGVLAALREHFLLCGDAIPEQKTPASFDDPLARRVAEVLRDRVAPIIHRDGGDIELVEVRDGVVVVQMVGACRTCPAQTSTLELGVEKALKEAFPSEVHRVIRL